MAQLLDMIDEAKKHIQSKTKIKPEYGIILGTGLGKLVDSINIDAEIPYETIPHFAVSTVEEHAGKLILGTLSGKPVMAMQGRFHFYEGYSHGADRFPGPRDEISARAYAHRFKRLRRDQSAIYPRHDHGDYRSYQSPAGQSAHRAQRQPYRRQVPRHVGTLFEEADRAQSRAWHWTIKSLLQRACTPP